MKAKKMINLKGTALEDTRVDQKNTPKWWRKVRNIAAIVFTVSTAAVTTIATAGIAAPAAITSTLTVISVLAGTISGGAALTKEKK